MRLSAGRGSRGPPNGDRGVESVARGLRGPYPGTVPREKADGNGRSAAYSGFRDSPTGCYADRIPEGSPRNSWLRPEVLWQSRNDRIATWIGDPVNDIRRAWIERLRREGRPTDQPVIDRRDLEDFSFLLLGDPGEGDHSQYAVAEALEARKKNTAFMLVASDVIYPTGDLADYWRKFIRPYERYEPPIYAVPGNHDWYDALQGFMFSFCGVDPPTPHHR